MQVARCRRTFSAANIKCGRPPQKMFTQQARKAAGLSTPYCTRMCTKLLQSPGLELVTQYTCTRRALYTQCTKPESEPQCSDSQKALESDGSKKNFAQWHSPPLAGHFAVLKAHGLLHDKIHKFSITLLCLCSVGWFFFTHIGIIQDCAGPLSLLELVLKLLFQPRKIQIVNAYKQHGPYRGEIKQGMFFDMPK